MPAIEVVPPQDPAPLDGALRALAGFDWIVFTSANAVRAVRERIQAPLPGGVRIASVGTATTDAIHRSFPGVEVSLEPSEEFRAEGLLEAFAGVDLAGRGVLLPLSDRARDVLAAGLTERGARVTTVVAYRTVTPSGLAARLRQELERGLDLLSFASPSAVEGFVSAAGGVGVPAAVIGPVTEAAARDAGLSVVVVARPATAEGLVAAIESYFASGARG